MQSGEAKQWILVATGSVANEPTFVATGLPAFANLHGPLLNVAPGRTDAGDYT